MIDREQVSALTTHSRCSYNSFITRCIPVMTKVLVAEHDAPFGDSVLHLLGKVAIVGEWVRSASELSAWAAREHRFEPSLVLLDWELPGAARGEPLRALQGLLPCATIVVLSDQLTGDGAAVLLSQGIASLHKPVSPFVLSLLVLDLSAEAAPPESGWLPARCSAPREGPSRPQRSFESMVAAYASTRRLSKQQALILDLYLDGKSDKEIADLCACSGATVYEHWRRMAKKSGGRQKSDLIADFHRYLRQSQPGLSGMWPGAVPHTGTFG
jgi:DNA-binding NarL/FixJ family response regulator